MYLVGEDFSQKVGSKQRKLLEYAKPQNEKFCFKYNKLHIGTKFCFYAKAAKCVRETRT